MNHTAAKKSFDGTANSGAVKTRKLGRAALKQRLTRAKRVSPKAGADVVNHGARRASPDQTGSFLRATARTPVEEVAQFLTYEDGLRLVEPKASVAPVPSGIQLTPLEIVELTSEPADHVLDNVAAVLRNFNEVESAVYALARRGSAAPKPVFSLRIHAAYRSRTVEILDCVRQAAAAMGLDAEVLLLDKTHVQSLRTNSIVFFPWRRRA